MVLDGTGVCPIGYSRISSEAECRKVGGQTVSGIRINSFATSGCKKNWTPPQTCFVHIDNTLNFVNNECGQNPDYDRHRIVCKKEGNYFKDVSQGFSLL